MMLSLDSRAVAFFPHLDVGEPILIIVQLRQVVGPLLCQNDHDHQPEELVENRGQSPADLGLDRLLTSHASRGGGTRLEKQERKREKLNYVAWEKFINYSKVLECAMII